MAKFKTALRNGRLDQITSQAGSTAYLKTYAGTVPTNPTDPPGGTLLCSLALPNPIASASSGGVLTFSAITAGTGAATGTPTFVRLTDSNTDDGTHTIVQYTAGIGSGEMSFSGQINSGGSVTVTSITHTEGNP